jgi:ribosomal protein S4E
MVYRSSYGYKIEFSKSAATTYFIKMRKGLILFIVCAFISCSGDAQEIIKNLNKGSKIIIEVTPHADRFVNHDLFHTFSITKVNETYRVLVSRSGREKIKELTEEEFKPFLEYIDKWYTKKYKENACDLIVLKIGKTCKNFSAVMNSDAQLLDLMLK